MAMIGHIAQFHKLRFELSPLKLGLEHVRVGGTVLCKTLTFVFEQETSCNSPTPVGSQAGENDARGQ